MGTVGYQNLKASQLQPRNLADQELFRKSLRFSRWNNSSSTTPAISTGNGPTVMGPRTGGLTGEESYTEIRSNEDEISAFLQCGMLSTLEVFQNKTGISE